MINSYNSTILFGALESVLTIISLFVDYHDRNTNVQLPYDRNTNGSFTLIFMLIDQCHFFLQIQPNTVPENLLDHSLNLFLMPLFKNSSAQMSGECLTDVLVDSFFLEFWQLMVERPFCYIEIYFYINECINFSIWSRIFSFSALYLHLK